MEIEVSVLVEIGMDGHCHIVADAQNGTEGVGTGTQVSYGAEVFPAGTFLLQGISVVAVTQNLDGCGLNLAGLTGSRTLNQLTFYTEASTSGNTLYGLLGEVCLVAHDLNVLDGASIVQGNEEDSL